MLFEGRHEVIKNNKMKLQRRKKAFNTLQKKWGKKMNFLEYVNFIIRRVECYFSIIGFIIIILSIALKGDYRKWIIFMI